MGDISSARSWTTQALDLYHDEETWPAAALALAGDSARPAKLVAELNAHHPKDSFDQECGIPQVRAALAIKSGNPSAAIEALKPAAAWEGADLGPAFYRGLAYLAMKSGKEAAVEFRKDIDRRTSYPLSPIHSLSQLEFARSLALAGDTTGARTAYQDFLALWKDADPDLPLLKQAQAEYAKLQ
jgi:predicted Zn-dependent protease